ncbi:MAG: sterol desaturase family protein [Burkholderiales bacterium]|jgi:sterol desaturase/sphingolipid hydroxylase (fatty acid hydroxylase superfamily)|nr:sterol desaturase family protein [Burkholderiales bacterium]
MQAHSRSRGFFDAFASYAFYPMLLAATLLLFAASLVQGWNLATVFAWMAGARFVLLLAVEFLHPARPQWRMTRASFWRDLKYIAVNGGIAAALKFGLGWLALDMSRFNTGLVTGMPVVVEFLAVLLVFEFFQYWFHRLSHEARGPVGAWLWKVHVAHHLPDKVYLLMHPVGHPLNFIVSLAIVQLPLVTLGARPETLFLFNALMGLQGLVSHFNVDIKAGPLNYLLVGAELHRFHHSANLNEAQNFGVLTPFWDLVFGTFRYDAKRLPDALGVIDPAQYPPSTAIGKVLLLPLRPRRLPTQG